MKLTINYITSVISLLIIAIGGIMMAGGIFTNAPLKNFMPGIMSTTLNSAICFMLAGLALYIRDGRDNSRFTNVIASTASWVILLAGFLHLSQYIFGWKLGIGELVWKETDELNNLILLVRISISISVNFILLGFILLTLKNKKYHGLIQALLVVIISIAFLEIFSHLFGVANFMARLTNIVLNTDILFILICFGIYYSMPLRYTRLSFKKKIVGVFVLVSMILGIIFFTFNKNTAHTIKSARLVDHTNKVLLKSQDVLGKVQDIVSAVRGFIITGDEEYLPPFHTAVGDINVAVQQLKFLTRDNLHQQARLDSLQKLSDKQIAIRDLMVTTRRKEGREAAIKIIEEGSGKKILDQMVAILYSIQQEESSLLVKRKSESELNVESTSNALKLLEVIAFLLLLVAFKVIYDNTHLRNKAEEEIKVLNATLEKRVNEKTSQVIEKEQQYRLLVENMREGIQLIGYDFRYIYTNNAVGIQSKYPDEELIGYTMPEKFPGIEHTAMFKILQECMTGRKSKTFENEFVYSDGSLGFFELRIQPVPEGLLILSMDISARKNLKKKLSG